MFSLWKVLLLITFWAVNSFAVQKNLFLASETTNKPNFDLLQTDNRLDQRFTFEASKYYVQPYLGAHFQKSDSTENIYDDQKSGLHLGVNFRLPGQIYVRAEHRFQKHTFGVNDTNKNREESRYGIYYYNAGYFKPITDSHKYSWEFYGESFYIPEIYKKASASLFWARAHYLLKEADYIPTIYVEAAAAENPTLDFGDSYQELRPGLRVYKSFSKSSVQFLVFKNVLPDSSQDVRALLAIYGEWPWGN